MNMSPGCAFESQMKQANKEGKAVRNTSLPINFFTRKEMNGWNRILHLHLNMFSSRSLSDSSIVVSTATKRNIQYTKANQHKSVSATVPSNIGRGLQQPWFFKRWEIITAAVFRFFLSPSSRIRKINWWSEPVLLRIVFLFLALFFTSQLLCRQERTPTSKKNACKT